MIDSSEFFLNSSERKGTSVWKRNGKKILNKFFSDSFKISFEAIVAFHQKEQNLLKTLIDLLENSIKNMFSRKVFWAEQIKKSSVTKENKIRKHPSTKLTPFQISLKESEE